jgi:hypothetical protein
VPGHPSGHVRWWSVRKPLRLRTSHDSLPSLSFSQSTTLEVLPDSLLLVTFWCPYYILKLLFWSRHGNPIPTYESLKKQARESATCKRKPPEQIHPSSRDPPRRSQVVKEGGYMNTEETVAPALRRQHLKGQEANPRRTRELESLWRIEKVEKGFEKNRPDSQLAQPRTMSDLDSIDQIRNDEVANTPSGTPRPSIEVQRTPRSSPRSTTSQRLIAEKERELAATREMNRELERRILAMEQRQMEGGRPNSAYPFMSGAIPVPAQTQYPGSQTTRQLPPSIRGPPTFFNTAIRPEPAITDHSQYPITTRDRPRAKAPSTFSPPKDDVRLWIMEIEDYLVAEHVTDPAIQALTARDYLAQSIKLRVMMARLNGLPQDTAKFNDWVQLKTWLFEEYGPRNTTIEADLRMQRCKMFENQSVQDFTNYFELKIQDVSWGYEERAVWSNYQLKLTKPILERIFIASNGMIPPTYAGLKQAAFAAEEFLRATARLFPIPKDNNAPPALVRPRRERRVEFDLPASGSNATPQTPRNPLGPSSGNSNGKRKETLFPDIPADQRKKMRREKLCFKCQRPGHFADECPGKDKPPR